MEFKYQPVYLDLSSLHQNKVSNIKQKIANQTNMAVNKKYLHYSLSNHGLFITEILLNI